jgi:hypothetical protein
VPPTEEEVRKMDVSVLYWCWCLQMDLHLPLSLTTSFCRLFVD